VVEWLEPYRLDAFRCQCTEMTPILIVATFKPPLPRDCYGAAVLLLVRLVATEFLSVFVAADIIGMIYFRVVLHR
jgi:hypothetical protein